jgi:predicted RNA-binding Zn ribbon-like protein
METRELPIVAGHLALDFANTVDDPLGPARHDHLATGDDLLRWSVRVGVLGADAAAALGPLPGPPVEAHALRDVLNAVFSAVATGVEVPWEELRSHAADAVAHAVLSGDFELAWPTDTPRAVLWPVAHAAATLLTSEDVHRVKQCAGCPWVFLDRSRNGSRRWCAMDDCGKYAKMRTYVARRAARRAGPPDRP